MGRGVPGRQLCPIASAAGPFTLQVMSPSAGSSSSLTHILFRYSSPPRFVYSFSPMINILGKYWVLLFFYIYRECCKTFTFHRTRIVQINTWAHDAWQGIACTFDFPLLGCFYLSSFRCRVPQNTKGQMYLALLTGLFNHTSFTKPSHLLLPFRSRLHNLFSVLPFVP